MAMVCPVCRDESVKIETPQGLRTYYDCENCGYFAVSMSLLSTMLSFDAPRLTPVQYAALSHRIRLTVDGSEEVPVLTTNLPENALTLPSPAEQAIRILQFFGDKIQQTGQPARNPEKAFVAKVGAANRASALRIVRQLADSGLLLVANRSFQGTVDEPDGIDLTLAGWEKFEAEQRGKLAGSYGFMALQFGDNELDEFQKNVLRPAVQSLGFTLEDMRDAARAGIIDNVMRARIRDAAFVLVDLTHGNSGAYWEAGFAEGLGKPVLYVCKQDVFDEKGTHFDTNHCTTVMWSPDKPTEFSEELVATLRRSLNLFSD